MLRPFRASHLRTGLLAGFVTLLSAGTTFAATDEERAGARSAAVAGLDAFNGGRFQESVELFEKAEAVVHSPVHLLYIARSHLQLGHLVEAREAYMKITREGAPEGASAAITDAVDNAEKELEQLEPRLPQVTVKVTGAGDKKFQLFVDGRELSAALAGISRPVNPGKHEFSVKAEGMKSTPVSREFTEGQRDEVVLTLEVDPNAPVPAKDTGGSSTGVDGGVNSQDFKWNGLTYGGLAAAGVGVAGGVVGTIFLLDSKAKHDEVQDLCGNPTNPERCELDSNSSQAQTVRDTNDAAGTSQIIGIIGVGVGAAGLITGAVLVYLGQQEPDATTAHIGNVTVTPVLGYQSIGFTGTF